VLTWTHDPAVQEYGNSGYIQRHQLKGSPQGLPATFCGKWLPEKRWFMPDLAVSAPISGDAISFNRFETVTQQNEELKGKADSRYTLHSGIET